MVYVLPTVYTMLNFCKGKNINMNFEHIPVLLNECIDNLKIKPNGIYVDGTMRWGRT